MKNEERRILARETLFDTISLHKTPQEGPLHYKYAKNGASSVANGPLDVVCVVVAHAVVVSFSFITPIGLRLLFFACLKRQKRHDAEKSECKQIVRFR